MKAGKQGSDPGGRKILPNCGESDKILHNSTANSYIVPQIAFPPTGQKIDKSPIFPAVQVNKLSGWKLESEITR